MKMIHVKAKRIHVDRRIKLIKQLTVTEEIFTRIKPRQLISLRCTDDLAILRKLYGL